MQEAGVPVTFAYISDAHDFHGVAGNIHIAYGPGEAGYVQQLKDYDKAFGDFFTRLKNDGITKDNTLFVVTVEEGDHFAGTAPDAPCDGVTTPCTYANGHVTEVNGDLKRLVATYNASHGTTATTDFSVHSRPGAERLHQRQPGPRLGDRAQPREGDVRHAGDEPAVGQDAERCSSRWPTRSRRSSSTWSRPTRRGRRRSRRSRKGDYFLNASSHADAVRRQRPVELRLPAEHDRRRTRRSPGTTAASSRRSARPGSAASDRASRRSSPDRQGSGPTTPTSGRRCSRCSG